MARVFTLHLTQFQIEINMTAMTAAFRFTPMPVRRSCAALMRSVVQLDAYRTTGAQFGSAVRPSGVRTSLFGQVTFSVSGANEAVLRWQAIDPAIGSGEMAMTRLTQPAGLACD